jgi:putative ABC transport system substrate-binding protein
VKAVGSLYGIVRYLLSFVTEAKGRLCILVAASAVGLVYFLAARLGLALLSTPSDVAVFWPASGIAVGILVLSGRRALLAVVMGVIAGTVAANIVSDRSVLTSLCKGFCNAGEAVLVAWLLEWWGRNLGIEYRGAEGRSERLSALGGDLIRLPVSVIVPAGVTVALAAKAMTMTVPIVFTIAGDAVAAGFVASIRSPGGNVTGVSTFGQELAAKRIQLLNEIVPGSAPIGVLVNPRSPLAEVEIRQMQAAGQALGRKLFVVQAITESEIEPAFAALARGHAIAVALGTDALFNSRLNQLAALAARAALPMVGYVREFAEGGGLTSHGASLAEAYRLTGIYVARILNGEKPADLPVIQDVKLELVINLKTAKALGLTIPATLLARADEVIE